MGDVEPITDGEVQDFAKEVDAMEAATIERHTNDIAEINQLDEAVADYEANKTVVSRSSEAIEGSHQIVRFRGRAMLMVKQPFPHYVPLHTDRLPDTGGRQPVPNERCV